MGEARRQAPKRWYRQMTIERAAEIRRIYFAREAKQAELAQRYGITQASVSRIVSGIVWSQPLEGENSG